MAGKTVVAILLVVCGVVLGVVASNALRSDGSEVPDRPKNVPDSAQWAGGADGGAWVQCKSIAKGTLACRVYADVTGVLMEEDGEFILNPDTVRPIFYSAGLIGADVSFERMAP